MLAARTRLLAGPVAATIAASGCASILGIDSWDPGGGGGPGGATTSTTASLGGATGEGGSGGSSTCTRACLGADCPPHGCDPEPWLPSLSGLRAVAAGGGHTCWIQSTGPGNGSVGCTNTASGISTSAIGEPTALAVSAELVAWAEGVPPHVYVLPLPAFSPKSELTSGGTNDNPVVGIAMGPAGRVFWALDGDLCWAEFPSGMRACDQHPISVVGPAVAETKLVWANRASLELKWVGATNTDAQTNGVSTSGIVPVDVTASGHRAFFTGVGAPGIQVVDLLQPAAPATLADTPNVAGPIVATTDAVYWITDGVADWRLPVGCTSTSTGAVWRARLGGRLPVQAELLAGSVDCPTRVAVDGAYVYWSTGRDETIWRAPR